jgi:EAL domain-containing protein (putative c-di-GMP-specific phosphodiesterase class I)
MYRTKELGRDGHQFYAPAMSARVLEQLNLESRLRRALAEGELRLHYQPIFDLATGRLADLEALVRWQDPDRGLVPPGEFIALAEMTGLILGIGRWVLHTACREIGSLALEGGFLPRLTINVSARQFHEGEVVEQVKRAVEETGFEPTRLELEVTETVAMRDQEATVEVMNRLKALGVRLSIDDFGTGYSSLAYLRRFPLDSLKIDRSFVKDVTSDASAAGIDAAVIAMAHQLNLRVVAEGVETGEQLDFLREHGCQNAQGFLLGRPMPLPELLPSLGAAELYWQERYPRETQPTSRRLLTPRRPRA